jgi:TPR repeat protein
VAWFRKAASAGNADAMHRLAIAYNNGHGVRQDDAQAAAWYRRAADLGQGSSMFYLGTMCWGGRGVKQDYAEAYKWLSLAVTYGPANERQRNADARDLLERAPQMTPDLLAQARERIAAWQQAFDVRKK